MVNGVCGEAQTNTILAPENLFALKENIVRRAATLSLSNSTREILRANRSVP
jgi:hypothetical protein